MNMAAYRGVYLWEVAREGAGMTMKAAGNSLELLQACAEKTGCARTVDTGIQNTCKKGRIMLDIEDLSAIMTLTV